MDGFIVIVAILGIGSLILPWINLARLNRLMGEIERLKSEVRYLRNGTLAHGAERTAPQAPAPAHPAIPAKASVPEFVQPQVQESNPASRQESSHEPSQELTQDTLVNAAIDDDFDWDEEDSQPTAKAAQKTTAKAAHMTYRAPAEEPKEPRSFEFNLSTKLTVWIGAASVALAVFYLVQYSIAQGLLDPPVRIMLGLIFGLVIAVGGYWAHERGRFANNIRVGQGITGAGLVALTFSLYSAANIYELISPLTGFIGMAAIVTSTAVLSLRMGPPIAAFSIVGGFAAPILFASETPNYTVLFTYLLILSSGLQYIVIRQKWWGLSVAALALSFVWALLVTLNEPTSEIGWVICMYVLGLSIVTAVFNMVYPDERLCDNAAITRSDFSTILSMALGAIMFLAVYSQIGFGPYEWMMSGLMSLMIMGLAALRPKPYTVAMYAKLGLDVLLLMSCLEQDPGPVLPVVLALCGIIIYGVIPGVVSRTLGRAHPAPWVIVQSAGLIGLYMASITHTSLFPEEFNAMHGWGLIGLLGSAVFIRETAIWNKAGQKIAAASASVAATSFLSIGLIEELPVNYLGAVFAFEAAALIWLSARLRIDMLLKLAYVMTGLYAMASMPMVLEHLTRVVYSVFGNPLGITVAQLNLTEIVSMYILPSLAFVAGYKIYARNEAKINPYHHILFAIPVLGGVGLLYMVMSMLLAQDAAIRSYPFGFIERGVFSLVIASYAAMLIGLSQAATGTTTRTLSALWGQLVVLVVLARVAYFDMFMYFPMENQDQEVGSLPIFNGVTLTYGLGLALALAARHLKIGVEEFPWLGTAYKIIALLFLLALESLTVRQYVHGSVLFTPWTDTMASSELYAYSVVWLLSGLALLAYGIKRSDRSLRVASLVFITLTIGKVFLIDAANLEGLYRVFSFLGLGVSLIGLSVFTTRYMNGLGNDKT